MPVSDLAQFTPVRQISNEVRHHNRARLISDHSFDFRSVDVEGILFDIDESWVIGGRVIYGYLLGDAADSPIVDRSGSRHQVTVGVGLSAQF